MQLSCDGFGPFKNGKGTIETTGTGVEIVKKGVSFGENMSLKTLAAIATSGEEGLKVPYLLISKVHLFKPGFMGGHYFLQLIRADDTPLKDSMVAIGHPLCFVFDKKHLAAAEDLKADIEQHL